MILIDLQALTRIFQSGNKQHKALDSVSLTIHRGEMVAITGPSGSGKSTLLNILGCLDSADSGFYHLAGTDVSQLDHNQLATLRRQHIGFIFQRYYLIDYLEILANVAMPTFYAGQPVQKSLDKAGSLLHQLGLGNKQHALPSALSGGQQQRVCIARALINDADIILADEPTGALDEDSAKEVMGVLRKLHAQGHTIVIVTHDKGIANQAGRIIEMKAGCIISDTNLLETQNCHLSAQKYSTTTPLSLSLLQQFCGAFYMAIASLRARKLRTLLTMSGVALGIAAVSTVVAIGNGAKQRTLENISQLGTNVVTLYNERPHETYSVGMTTEDALILEAQPWVKSVSPELSLMNSVKYQAKKLNVMAKGVSTQWFSVKDYTLIKGRLFQDGPGPEVVISQGMVNSLSNHIDIGDILLAGDTPLHITGIVREKGYTGQRYAEMWVHWKTAVQRINGHNRADSIVLRMRDDYTGQAALNQISQLITLHHGIEDFSLFNADSIRRSTEQASLTLRILILMIGLIALLTGMVGVMNTMLISASERIHEIGVRMATGARRSDIMSQFLLEAIITCLSGGVLGVLFSLAVNPVLVSFGNGMLQTIYSWEATVGAFSCALLFGLIAGYLPAFKAARMNPVVALAGN